jgi:hypothetical protein
MRELFHKCKRRLRFSLLTLLVFVSVIAVAAGVWRQWSQQRSEAASALRDLEGARRGYEKGLVALDWYLTCSRRYCFEACDVPFADKKAAVTAYRERLAIAAEFLRYGHADDSQRKLSQVAELLKEAAEWEANSAPTGVR